jgi:hypothetical protein
MRYQTLWRPGLGWVGLLTVAGQGVAIPACNVVLSMLSRGQVPYMPGELLLTIAGLTLGTAGLRSLDKIKGTAPKV